MDFRERYIALSNSVNTWAADLNRRLGEAKLLAQQGKDYKEQVEECGRLSDIYTKVMHLFHSFSTSEQEQLKNTIEALVTRGLRVVFGEEFSFLIEGGIERNQPVFNFRVVSAIDGKPITTEIMDGKGGGLANVCGFLLRLLVVVLLRDRTTPILIADEEFDQLSDEYIPRAGELLRTLCDQLDVQILMVSHKSGFTDFADKLHRFSLVNGVTQVVSS